MTYQVAARDREHTPQGIRGACAATAGQRWATAADTATGRCQSVAAKKALRIQGRQIAGR